MILYLYDGSKMLCNYIEFTDDGIIVDGTKEIKYIEVLRIMAE